MLLFTTGYLIWLRKPWLNKYENKEWGLSFNYPKDWFVDESLIGSQDFCPGSDVMRLLTQTQMMVEVYYLPCVGAGQKLLTNPIPPYLTNVSTTIDGHSAVIRFTAPSSELPEAEVSAYVFMPYESFIFVFFQQPSELSIFSEMIDHKVILGPYKTIIDSAVFDDRGQRARTISE